MLKNKIKKPVVKRNNTKSINKNLFQKSKQQQQQQQKEKEN